MLASYVVLAVSLVAAANAYSTGAPESVCVDMVPKHPVPKQSSPPPYVITTSTKVRCDRTEFGRVLCRQRSAPCGSNS